jgi:alkylated DNA repair dioxygenase AlkB
LQPGLFGDALEGFLYREDLFTPEAEADLIRAFDTLPFRPFEFHGRFGNRRIVSFGFQYDYGGRRLRQAPAIPEFLHPLKEAAARFSGLPAERFAHALVTEYMPGAGIGWHRDKPTFRNVVALSFGSSCRLRFRRASNGKWQRVSQLISGRSAYLLSGPARAQWEHSIPEVDGLRYSVTFRDFEPDYDHGASE